MTALSRRITVSACLVGTVVMLSLTHRWSEVGFFAAILCCGVIKQVGMASRRAGEQPPWVVELWRRQANLDAAFWILIYAGAVTQLFFSAVAWVPLALWIVRFASLLVWSALAKRPAEAAR